MIRIIDFALAALALVILLPIIFILLLAGYFDTGKPLFIQKRLGKNQKPFNLIKLRSMNIGTAHVGTHEAKTSDVTSLGKILRKYKLDEIPQLINVLFGDMSLVGPRPGLPNQEELRQERELRNIFDVRPGITGLGQVNDIDMSTPKKLSRYDNLMNSRMNLCLYFGLLFSTVTGKGMGDRVRDD